MPRDLNIQRWPTPEKYIGGRSSGLIPPVTLPRSPAGPVVFPPGGCPDWTTLLVDTGGGSPILTPNDGTTIFTPASGDMHIFTAKIAVPQGQGVQSSEHVLCDGILPSFSGGPCISANLQIAWSAMVIGGGTFPWSPSNNDASVLIQGDAWNVHWSVPSGGLANGTYQIPFTIPAPVAGAYDIDVSVAMNVSTYLGRPDGFTLQIIGTITS